MWLLLCDLNDEAALWARRGLEQRGLTPFELLTPEMLGPSQLWNHRIGEGGGSITLGISATKNIHGESVRGVLNRLTQLPHWGPLHEAAADDRRYAAHEIAAFFVSWLWALPRPMLNAPTPRGLSGEERNEGEWTFLAARAGLTTAPYQKSSDGGCPIGQKTSSPDERTKTMIVVDEHVLGARLPDDALHACVRLGALSGSRLLGVRIRDNEDGSVAFAGATVHPDLRQGGEGLLDALAYALRCRGGS